MTNSGTPILVNLLVSIEQKQTLYHLPCVIEEGWGQWQVVKHTLVNGSLLNLLCFKVLPPLIYQNANGKKEDIITK